MLFERHPHPIWLYDPDTLRFLAANDSAVRRYGWSREEFLGMTLLDIRPEADAEALREEIRRLPPDRTIVSREARHRTREGEVMSVRVTSSPIRFDGRPARMVIAEDLTEHLRVRSALRDTEERYGFLFAQISEGVWRARLDPPVTLRETPEADLADGAAAATLVECNAAMARMYAVDDPARLLGQRLDDTFDPGDPRTREFFLAFVRGGCRASELESYEHDHRGEPRWYLNDLIGIVEDGRLTGIWGLQRDITARKRAEEAMQFARSQLATLVDASPVPIVAMRPDGAVMSWNRAAEAVFGWTEAEALGRPLVCVP
ncbi:MAG TPA: PAS domain S-box protein, partial [Gemmatimonadales bacterium]|nr:PAS domain S-box protein [Gemmatimonadales bacterium]